MRKNIKEVGHTLFKTAFANKPFPLGGLRAVASELFSQRQRSIERNLGIAPLKSRLDRPSKDGTLKGIFRDGEAVEKPLGSVAGPYPICVIPGFTGDFQKSLSNRGCRTSRQIANSCPLW